MNVTARIDSGVACPVASSHAMRVVSTRVLPLPAPARISAERVRQRDRGELFGIEVVEERVTTWTRAGAAQAPDDRATQSEMRRPHGAGPAL